MLALQFPILRLSPADSKLWVQVSSKIPGCLRGGSSPKVPPTVVSAVKISPGEGVRLERQMTDRTNILGIGREVEEGSEVFKM